MRDIYEKIEKIYANKESNEPSWVVELRVELKEIKELLNALNRPRKKRRKAKAYFDFVKLFRERLKADTINEIYPEILYNKRRIGANFRGLLYDKATAKLLHRYEAFAIYEYFYEKKEPIDNFIIVN